MTFFYCDQTEKQNPEISIADEKTGALVSFNCLPITLM